MYLNSKIIKSKALKLGFDKIGISKAERNVKAKKILKYGYRKIRMRTWDG